MVDRYFIKSFLSTCLFVGGFTGGLIALSFVSLWVAWFLSGAIVLFFSWYYQWVSKAAEGMKHLFSLTGRLMKACALLLERLRVVRQ